MRKKFVCTVSETLIIINISLEKSAPYRNLIFLCPSFQLVIWSLNVVPNAYCLEKKNFGYGTFRCGVYLLPSGFS